MDQHDDLAAIRSDHAVDTHRGRPMVPPSPGLLAATGVGGLAGLIAINRARRGRSSWPHWSLVAGATAVAVNEAAGKPVVLLRWSALRLFLGMKHLLREWQVGDGREQAMADHVSSHAEPGDIDDAIRAIDEFCWRKSFLINVGDEKGAILDRAVHRAQPRRVLELGSYCGYSALRIIRAMPSGAHLWSVEVSPANAAIARRVWEHAGVGDRVTAVIGFLGDGGRTIRRLREQDEFGAGGLDLVFIDHAKEEYVPDLERILEQGWLHPGSIVVADNVRFPGAPEYLDYMRRRDGHDWRTVEHHTHVEYQSVLPDLVLESEYQRPTTAGAGDARTGLRATPPGPNPGP
ncbi:O-methyltransferase [Actinomycetospora endophytica]|uniref:O-methyltransferase n=1 Tax=Actinomycetospora endophytica TaxID=2291215 RepID=A0ABS8PE53_9PSEU|nr:O-methyltransferase [Actinomycetospora endophytica]MCD2195279.1 O-methyltransferase [Actinomycetospora endophytica]